MIVDDVKLTQATILCHIFYDAITTANGDLIEQLKTKIHQQLPQLRIDDPQISQIAEQLTAPVLAVLAPH